MARYLQDNVAIADRDYNSTLNAPSSAMSAEDIATEEAALSSASLGIVARVIFSTGSYTKVKFFYNKKPLAIFKSRDYVRAEALAFLETVKNDYDVYSTLGLDSVTTLDLTTADNTLAPAATSQNTVMSTTGEDDPVDVTALAEYSSSDTAVATVNAAGLVTAVAAGVKASRVLTSTGTAPANDATVVLGAKTYTFKTTLTGAANEVLIGASAAAALDNLKSAVNATAGAGTTYGTGTTANATIDATTNTDTTQLFEAKTAGTGGNALASTETSAQLSFPGVTFAGGAAGTSTVTARYRGESDTVVITVDV